MTCVLIFCENAQAIDGALLGVNRLKSGNNQDNISFVYVRNQTPLSFNISSQSNYQMSKREELQPRPIPAFYTSPLGNALIASKPESYQIFLMKGLDFESNSYLMGFQYLGTNIPDSVHYLTFWATNKNDDRATVSYTATDTYGSKLGFKIVAKVRDSKGTSNFSSVVLQGVGSLLGGADGMAMGIAGNHLSVKRITDLTSQLSALRTASENSRLLLGLTEDMIEVATIRRADLMRGMATADKTMAEIGSYVGNNTRGPRAMRYRAAKEEFKVLSEELVELDKLLSKVTPVHGRLGTLGVTVVEGRIRYLNETPKALSTQIAELEKVMQSQLGMIVEVGAGKMLPLKEVEALLQREKALSTFARTVSRGVMMFSALVDITMVGLLIHDSFASGDEFGGWSSQLSKLNLEPIDNSQSTFENIVDEVDIQEVRIGKKIRVSFMPLERPYLFKNYEPIFVYRDHDAATVLSILPEEQALPTGAYKNRCITMDWNPDSRNLHTRCYRDGLLPVQIESAMSYDLMRPESDTSSNGIAQGVDNTFNVNQCILGTDVNVDAVGNLVCAVYPRWEPKLIRNADWMSDFGSEIYTFDKTTFRLSGKDATTGNAAIITSIDYAKECQENTNLSLIKNNENKTVGSYSLRCVSPKQQGMTNLFTGAIQSAKEAVRKMFS